MILTHKMLRLKLMFQTQYLHRIKSIRIFFKMKKTHPHVQFKRQSNFKHSIPLSTYDIEHRKRWAIRQVSVLANISSTAVLGA